MPYVPEEARRQLDKGRDPSTPGELNYLISMEMKETWDHYPRYQTLNDIRGDVQRIQGHWRDWERWGAVPDVESDFVANVLAIILSYRPHKEVVARRRDISGALGCAWAEFYARVGRPYEETAIARNGDIY